VTKSAARPNRLAGLPLIGALLAIVLCVVVVATWLYRQEAIQTGAEAAADLSAIGQLKVDEIDLWRQERLGDVTYAVSGSLFRAGMVGWVADSGRTDLKDYIWERMLRLQDAFAYDSIRVATPTGAVLLDTDPVPEGLAPAEIELVKQAFRSSRPLLGDFFRLDDGQVRISAAGPVFDDSGRPVAAIVLRRNPDNVLLPLLDSWPSSSPSAESLLVRRDGSDVLFINKPRFHPGPPMSLRLPLSRTEVVAVKALTTGTAGLIEGYDYRGREVAADVRSIPGANWLLVSQVDKDELLAEALYRQHMTMVVMVLVALLAAAAVFAYQWRRRQVVYRNLWQAEKASRETEEEMEATLYSIGDAVITTDGAGRVRRMNPVAAGLAGWSEQDARGRPLGEVFRIVNEETRLPVASPVEKALQAGAGVELANHTMLLSRDGQERPIADSAAPIRDDAGQITGVVLVFRDQTDERRIKKALEEDAARLRILFNQANDGIVLVSDGEVLDANPAFAVMIGRTPQELLRLHVWDWDADLATAETYFEAYPQVPRNPGTIDVRMRRPNGTVIDVEVSYSPIEWKGRRAVFNVCREVTERRRANEALRRSEQQFREFVEFIPQLVWMTDATGQAVYLNQRWSDYTGLTASQCLGGGWLQAVFAEDAERVNEAWQRAVTTGCPYDIEYRLRRHDGEPHWFSVSGVPLRDLSGAVSRWIGVCTDIHEIKDTEALLEKSLEARTRDLVLARDRAEAASRVKDVFLATMSHELRTPLNSIIGFSDLMMNGISGHLSAEQAKQVQIINKSGHHLLGLISDVLDISKVEAGQMPLEIQPVSLRELFEEQRVNFDMPARERGLALEIELPDPTVSVRADAKRARQVLSNLLSNAVKYTDRGNVRLSSEVDGARVRVTVEDTGIGIPPDELPGMFQPFHRVPVPKGVVRDGTGLGLAIARRLMTAMDGEIGVESEPGQGSRFWITLPRA
jgi:two-component system sensor histidine kinase/response regulator